MNYKKLIGYTLDAAFVFESNIETEAQAKELVKKICRHVLLSEVTLIKKRVFTLYDYSRHKGIALVDFLNEQKQIIK